MGLIYLGQPYYHEERHIMMRRVHAAQEFTAFAIEKGLFVYSPIVHNHQLAVDYGLEQSWDRWGPFDLTVLAASSELWVLALDGWDLSHGLDKECDWWENNRDKPIQFIDWESFVDERRIILD